MSTWIIPWSANIGSTTWGKNKRLTGSPFRTANHKKKAGVGGLKKKQIFKEAVVNWTGAERKEEAEGLGEQAGGQWY